VSHGAFSGTDVAVFGDVDCQQVYASAARYVRPTGDYHVSNIALTISLLAVGGLLTAAGVFVYRTGLKLFGFLLGAGLGFFLTSAVGLTGMPQLAVILVVGVVGLWIARKIYLIMIVVPGAVTGFGAALVYTGTSMDPITNLVDPVILSGPVIGAVVALLLQKVVVVFVSAAWGAYLTWAGLATDQVVTALASLSVPMPPTWVLGLFGAGVVAQIGTWFLTKRYSDDELRAKMKGLFGGGGGAESQPGGGA
jgi:hypothetical protein